MVQSVRSAAVRVAEIMYPADTNALLDEVFGRCVNTVSSPEGERLLASVAAVKKKATKSSVEAHVSHAILCNALSQDRIQVLKADGVVTLGGASYDQSLKDFRGIVETGRIVTMKRKLQRFDESIVTRAVEFMLLQQNIGVLSWGQKKVNLDEFKTVELPSLTRCVPEKLIYDAYISSIQSRVSQGTFFNILSAITNGNQKLLTAVDYVTGTLINDTTKTLMHIVDDFISDNTEHECLNMLMLLAKNFLKNQSDSHAVRVDGVCSHGIEYGLSPRTASLPNKLGECRACCFPSYIINEIRLIVERRRCR